jgi:hypothetical protein
LYSDKAASSIDLKFGDGAVVWEGSEGEGMLLDLVEKVIDK